MSIVRSDIGGEQIQLDDPGMPPTKRRVRDAELLDIIAGEMYVKKSQGWSSPRIAKLFKCSRQHVNRQIATLSPGAKEHLAWGAKYGIHQFDRLSERRRQEYRAATARKR